MKTNKLFIIVGVVFLLFTASSNAKAYVITPEPQQVIMTGEQASFDAGKVAVSSSISGQDSRILIALKKFLPDMKVSGNKVDTAAGGLFIYVAEKADAFTDLSCKEMGCEGIDPTQMAAQEYFLGVKKLDGRVVVLILFNKKEIENGVGDSYGAYYGVKTLQQLITDGSIQEISIRDWPDFKVRGMLEGFYGKPWHEEPRNEMISWMSNYKMNIFLYTPKDDHKLRMGWRLKLVDKELNAVKELNDLAEENYIRYCWSLSPGMSVNFSSEKDMISAYQKLKSVIDVGVKCFSFAFDDVGPTLSPYDTGKFATYWEGQVAFTNTVVGKLLDKYPDVTFAFVPNDYWGNLAMESESLRYLGEHLDQRVQLGWTGDEIAPDRIVAEDAVLYSYFIKRKPILGDNYPVLDNIDIRGGRLALGPLRGRDPRLFRYTAGFVGNAMPLPLSSKPAYITLADFAWNPMNYDADRSWLSAYKSLMGENNYEPLYFLSQQSQSSLIWKYDAMELNELTRAVIRATQGLPDYVPSERIPELRKMLERFKGIETEIAKTSTPETAPMLEEMKAWITKLADYGVVGEKLLNLIEKKTSGKEVSAEEISAVEAEWKKVEENTAVITRMVMFNFMKQGIALLRGEPLPEPEKMSSLLGE